MDYEMMVIKNNKKMEYIEQDSVLNFWEIECQETGEVIDLSGFYDPAWFDE